LTKRKYVNQININNHLNFKDNDVKDHINSFNNSNVNPNNFMNENKRVICLDYNIYNNNENIIDPEKHFGTRIAFHIAMFVVFSLLVLSHLI
jgi:hypothetical protein